MKPFLFLFFLWAAPAFAQTYPDYQSTTVNDYAEMLGPQDEAALSGQLDRLRRDTGVQMTVLTLNTQADHAPGLSLEQFATGLFDHWGIGDADRNDGVLVLILRNDRAMRVELGAAYGHDWDGIAKQVVDDQFLEAIAVGDYGRGIIEGSAAIRERIVLPFLAGGDAPASSDSIAVWLVGGFFGLVLFGQFRQPITDGFARFRTCPRCGRRGMHQSRRVTQRATTASAGTGLRRVRCNHCDYDESTPYTIARISRSTSSGGFGGGRSGGGGASGRW